MYQGAALCVAFAFAFCVLQKTHASHRSIILSQFTTESMSLLKLYIIFMHSLYIIFFLFIFTHPASLLHIFIGPAPVFKLPFQSTTESITLSDLYSLYAFFILQSSCLPFYSRCKIISYLLLFYFIFPIEIYLIFENS